MENKNNNPVSIRFVTKTSDIIIFFFKYHKWHHCLLYICGFVLDDISKFLVKPNFHWIETALCISHAVDCCVVHVSATERVGVTF